MAEMSDASLVFLDDEEVGGGIAEETKSVKISIEVACSGAFL